MEKNVDKILALLDDHGIHGTFFWLGWVAERHRPLLRRCSDAGHEIASHGYSHVQPLRVGPTSFRDDVQKAKKTIEDIIGKQVDGFRTAGFGADSSNAWVFDVIKEAGYQYDSSIFLARGGRANVHGAPYVIHTRTGPLIEIPIPAIRVLRASAVHVRRRISQTIPGVARPVGGQETARRWISTYSLRAPTRGGL